MATEKNIPNLIINKVENQDVFDYLVSDGLVNENELYLIPGEAGGVTDVGYSKQTETGDVFYSVVDQNGVAQLGEAAIKPINVGISSVGTGLVTGQTIYNYVADQINTVSTNIDKKVNIESVDISGTTNTLLGLTQALVPSSTSYKQYQRWICKTDGGSSGISDKPTGNTNAGFVCEAYMNRFASITDYRYKLICWVQGDNYPYIATVDYNTSSISWTHWADTKNTTGSTDTSSKIYLVGATSQAANPQTYSDNEIYATSGVLTTKSVQVGGTAATMQYNSTDKCIEFVFA